MLKVRAKHYTRCIAFLLRTFLSDSEFFILAHFLFKEICFAFQGDKVHKRERILRMINLTFHIIIVKY